MNFIKKKNIKQFILYLKTLETMIFKLKLIIILTAILFLSSCAKEEIDCRTELFGTYSGIRTCTDPSGTSTSTSSLTISKSAQENKVVITISGLSLIADISADCSSLNILPQIINGSGLVSSTISGDFILNGTSLTGNFIITDNNWINSCTLNFTQL